VKRYHQRWAALTNEKKLEFIQQALAAKDQHKVGESVQLIYFCVDASCVFAYGL
jgi:hypothetical protein